MAMPNLNNHNDISKLMDKYLLKFVRKNSHLSKKIHNDCYDIIMIVLKKDFIRSSLNRFENEEDAYHYLAFIAQFIRLSNKYDIITGDKNNYFNIDNIRRAIVSYKFIVE